MSSLPHIVHLITHLGRGGAARNVLLSCLGLVRRGFRVSLLSGPSESPERELIEQACSAGVVFQTLLHLQREIHPLADLAAAREIREALRRARPDLLHTHQSKAGLLGRWIGKKLFQVPVVHTAHGHVFEGYFSDWRTACFVELERQAARWCDRLIGLTWREVEDHLALGVGFRARWRVIHSGIDPAAIRDRGKAGADVRRSMGFPGDAIVLASVGRLEPVKGIVDFLPYFRRALLREPRLRWVIIGDGSARSRIEEAIRGLDLVGKVALGGWLENPHGLIAGCDALLHPARNEGMGRAIVEAFALGLPVFAANAGSIPELLSDPARGLLFDWRRREAIPDRLLEFVGQLPELAAARETRMAAAQEYSVEGMVEKLALVYRDILC